MSDDAKIKVLVLDDDPAMQSLLLRQLKSNGLEVVAARDGLDGLARLESFSPDVIVSDVGMPGLDGFGFLDAVKQGEATRAIPVIFLTAQDDPQSMQKGLGRGACFYLTKPVRTEKLVATIRQAVHKRDAH